MIPLGVGKMAIDIGRRQFISVLGGAAAVLLLRPRATRAQQGGQLRTIGVMMNYAENDPEGEARFSALRDQLGQLGWADGHNVQIEVRWAAGRPDLMLVYATQLVSQPADVIVAQSTLVLTVLQKLTSTIPIVFTQVGDPLGSGFVTNYARPDGNITGFTDLEPSVAGKWIEVLKEVAPQIGRVTVLLNPDQINHQRFLQVIESTAPAFKVQVSAAAVRDRAGIEQAMASMAGQTDSGLVVLPGPVNNTQRHLIIQSTTRYRLPAVYPFKYYVTDGGLLSYGDNQADQWPNAASYVDRILKGEKIADLPVQAPTKYDLAINLKAAKTLGLTVPPTLIARADEVIE
jgi:putative ABC transport system substrate-binding protein